MARRSIAWVKDGGLGLEFADVDLEPHRLTAVGIAIGTSPVAYRMDYKLETLDGFVTSGLLVESRGEGWSRTLELRRTRTGTWSVRASVAGSLDLPAPGGDVLDFAESLDCDLALSPLTNTMPVLRHGLLEGGGPLDFVMAWVSVPDLSVHRSGQRYTFLRREGANSIVRYESSARDFVAELAFDSLGLVIAYPGIGRRIDQPAAGAGALRRRRKPSQRDQPR
jgi:hypothetical protein